MKKLFAMILILSLLGVLTVIGLVLMVLRCSK